jgi:hypothetical protein
MPPRAAGLAAGDRGDPWPGGPSLHSLISRIPVIFSSGSADNSSSSAMHPAASTSASSATRSSMFAGRSVGRRRLSLSSSVLYRYNKQNAFMSAFPKAKRPPANTPAVPSARSARVLAPSPAGWSTRGACGPSALPPALWMCCLSTAQTRRRPRAEQLPCSQIARAARTRRRAWQERGGASWTGSSTWRAWQGAGRDFADPGPFEGLLFAARRGCMCTGRRRSTCHPWVHRARGRSSSAPARLPTGPLPAAWHRNIECLNRERPLAFQRFVAWCAQQVRRGAGRNSQLDR